MFPNNSTGTHDIHQ